MKTLVLSAETKKLQLQEVEDVSLEYMQGVVKGHIELCYIKSLDEVGIDLFCNEEGKLINLEPSCYLVVNNDGEDEIYDVLCGDLLFCSHTEDGDSIGLTYEQIKIVEGVINNHLLFAGKGLLPYIEFDTQD